MAEIELHGAPDKNTPGSIGDICTDLTTGKRYECTSVYTFTSYAGAQTTYQWEPINNNTPGSGATPEQIAQIEKNKNDITNLYKSKANVIIDTASGESIVITDSVEAKLENLRVFGKSEQDSTTGKNLAKFTNEKNSNHKSFSYESETERVIIATKLVTGGSFVARFEAVLKGGTKYAITANSKLPIYCYLDELWGTHIYASQAPFSVTPETDGVYVFGVYADSELGSAISVSDFMVRNASITDTAYEPYTGGIASPSPEYPQEITSVGDGGDIEVVVRGKNLIETFNNTNSLNQYVSVLYAQADLKPNTTYTLSFKGTVGNSYYFNESLRTYWGGSTVVSGVNKITFTTPAIVDKGDKNQYISELGGWLLLKNNTTNAVHVFEDVQIEEGTVATDYEAYTRRTLAIPTPNGLRGIKVTDASLATYTDADGQMWCSDEIDFERGVYVQRIGKYKFTGSEYWQCHGNKTDGSDGFYTIKDVGQIKNSKIKDSMFTHFVRGWINGNSARAFVGHDSIQIVAPTIFTSVEKLKEFLQNNDSYVMYILETPIETPLSTEEIEAYKALHTNCPTTTLLSEAHMEVSYVADTKKYIDKKFAEISTALVAMGGI